MRARAMLEVRPRIYDLDEAGLNIYRGQEVEIPDGEERTARMGMKAFPERAITNVEA